MYCPVPTITLQDGSLFNFTRRVTKHHQTLVTLLAAVHDGRSGQGKRHALPIIVLLLFAGITAGYTTIDQCHLFAVQNRRWIEPIVGLPHGIPDPTTISRALQVCDVASLLATFRSWQKLLVNQHDGMTASLDGKTLRGVHGEATVGHILSLLVHQTKQTIGQVGVSGKENEIPAGQRLLSQTPIAGLTIVADAIHTQQATVKTICKGKADYLLMVKDNQRQLAANIALALNDRATVAQQETYRTCDRGRRIRREVTLSYDPALRAYLAADWYGVQAVGRIRRFGTRVITGHEQSFQETVYFITSKDDLSAKGAAKIIQDHWQIENNLHWQKDWTFLEDRQTLRLGNAPQAMSLLRSMAIGLLHGLGVSSVSQSLSVLQMNRRAHRRLLALAAVI